MVGLTSKESITDVGCNNYEHGIDIHVFDLQSLHPKYVYYPNKQQKS